MNKPNVFVVYMPANYIFNDFFVFFIRKVSGYSRMKLMISFLLIIMLLCVRYSKCLKRSFYYLADDDVIGEIVDKYLFNACSILYKMTCAKKK